MYNASHRIIPNRFLCVNWMMVRFECHEIVSFLSMPLCDILLDHLIFILWRTIRDENERIGTIYPILSRDLSNLKSTQLSYDSIRRNFGFHVKEKAFFPRVGCHQCTQLKWFQSKSLKMSPSFDLIFFENSHFWRQKAVFGKRIFQTANSSSENDFKAMLRFANTHSDNKNCNFSFSH